VTRVVGVDLGSRRIGVAVSDASGLIAQPRVVLERTGNPADDHDLLLRIARDEGADTIVVGLPLTLEGDTGRAARQVLSEVDELRRRAGEGITVVVHDERFSTVTAQDALIESGMRRRDRRDTVDKVAAAVVLQSWLDGRRGDGPG
jgi:putative Holliday junction resolvase